MEKKSHKTASKSGGGGGGGTVTTQIGAVPTVLSATQAHSHHHSGTNKHRNSPSSHHHNNHYNSPQTLTLGHPTSANVGVKSLHATSHTTGKSNNCTTLANTAEQSANALEHISSSKVSTLRNKNEEAINDLRQRIPEIENIFDVHSRIGNGTFSTVLLGTLKKERELPENMRRKFAIKHHIPTSHPDRIMKELQCMAKIGGTDNVVGINCCIRYNESVAFIMPYMPHDRFHDFFNKMELSEVQNYMRNLLVALRHVHKFNVIHRDVKPSNFLYNRRKRQFLLVDFGLAQQVPTPQLTAIEACLTSGHGGALPPNVVGAVEGKRMRDTEESVPQIKAAESPAAHGDVSGSAKRLRCTGPQGDHQPLTAIPAPPARVVNSCIVGGSPFKMPLKQLNEISAPVKQSNATSSAANANAGAANNNNNNNNGTSGNNNTGICEQPLGRQTKSAVINTSLVGGNRLQQQKQRQQGGANAGGGGRSSNNSSAAAAQMPAGGGPAAAANAEETTNADGTNNNNNNTAANAAATAARYNTNRNLAATNAPKCFCYGNPQVCNICLIKKEIHASRAGTPGYRPPEVLLKYPDQTTSVDIWAAGVIFLSILSSVYPFFKAPNDFVALAEMVTIFGDKTIRKTAFVLDRLVTLSQKTKPLDLRKLCVRFRNRIKFSSPELLKKYQRSDGSCEVCKNCDQFYFNCLCTETNYNTEPLDSDDPFPESAYDLLYKLLEVNPHKRITAAEALNHPFFSEVANLANTTAASSNTAEKK